MGGGDFSVLRLRFGAYESGRHTLLLIDVFVFYINDRLSRVYMST